MVPFSHIEDREIENWILKWYHSEYSNAEKQTNLVNETFLMSAEEYNLIHDGSSLKYECHVVVFTD